MNTTNAQLSVGTAPATAAIPGRWVAAVVMTIAALMDMIDITIVNVALPTIRGDLDASGTQVAWILSAYMLAFAATLIVAGSFGDLFGRRRIFLLGIAGFGLASLGAGLAQNAEQLIAARVVQGVGAAAMMPQVLATFRAIFGGKERGQAFGLYGAILGFASAIGLVLGGVLTEADLFGWGWRTIFLVNIPVALFSLVATTLFVPETRDRAGRRPDLLGAGLLAAALVAIAYPLLEGRKLGWPAWNWLLLAAGVALLGLLGLVEARRHRPEIAPLLRPQLFRIPAFSAGLAVQFAFSAGLQGFFLAFALWLQAGQGFSPLRAGVTSLSFSVGGFLLAPVSVPLAVRYGRLVLVAGALLLAGGVGLVDLGAEHVGAGGSPWPIVPGLALGGAGLALLVIPLANVVLAAVPSSAAGGASGLFTTAQQLGGAIGVAAVGTVFFGYLDGHTFLASFQHSAPYVMAAFVASGLLALILPRTAVDEEELVADDDSDISIEWRNRP
jgi:EmrB/QacA subfamily drug resistance transporter